MKLTNILKNIDYIAINFSDINITGIEHDSRKIKPGDIYVCLTGLSVDGHDYARAACDAGAVCIISEREIYDLDAVQIVCDDTRQTYALAASNWYGNPHESLEIIAVTGTKGKTTTTQIINTVLESAGIKTSVMGTLGTYINGVKHEQKLTTPDPMDFHRLLKEIVDEGCKYLVMELSAHALYLKKTEPVKFKAGIFTNLSHDHLDDFVTMENYKNAKRRLFTNKKCEMAIINSDDVEAGFMIQGFENELVTYSIESGSDYKALNVECGLHDIKYELLVNDQTHKINFNIPGRFNVYNSLAAIVLCIKLGIDIKAIIEGISHVKNVDGRMESVDCGQNFNVIVDYAHSPDSLKNVLTAARGFTQNRVLSVFGCGGDRDAKKRPVMGKLSGELADFTIVTSDNPRTEDPDAIIDMIEDGIKDFKYIRITDRRIAIYRALEEARAGDVVVIAGKGHETYQDVMGEKHHFDDREVVKEYFEEQRK